MWWNLFYSRYHIVKNNCQRWRLNPETVMLQVLWLGIFITNSIRGNMGSTLCVRQIILHYMLLDRQDGTVTRMCHISLFFNTHLLGLLVPILLLSLSPISSIIPSCLYSLVCNIPSFIRFLEVGSMLLVFILVSLFLLDAWFYLFKHIIFIF